MTKGDMYQLSSSIAHRYFLEQHMVRLLLIIPINLAGVISKQKSLLAICTRQMLSYLTRSTMPLE